MASGNYTGTYSSSVTVTVTPATFASGSVVDVTRGVAVQSSILDPSLDTLGLIHATGGVVVAPDGVRAVVDLAGGTGVALKQAGTLMNAGYIQAAGAVLVAPHAAARDVTLQGGVGADLAGGGTVQNFSYIQAIGGVVAAPHGSVQNVVLDGGVAVELGQPGVVQNYAYIEAAGGVLVAQRGVAQNVDVKAAVGVDLAGGGTVQNFGLIDAAGGAVVARGGIAQNVAVQGGIGVELGAAGVVDNYGTISAEAGHLVAQHGIAHHITETPAIGVDMTAGSTLLNAGLIQATDAVAFNGTGSDLILEAKGGNFGVAGSITGFVAGDTIDLANVANAGVAVGNGADFVLTITSNGHVVGALDFAGPYTASSFQLSSNGSGGTDITASFPCFAEGTHVATPQGEVAVETLAEGSLVLTASGATRPISWIGTRSIDCNTHPVPTQVWPVRVRSGAFGDGLPRRDLLISPGHAVFVDGLLIPVAHLINGASIFQERVASVTYYHIELDSHDVLLSEGLASESYLDTGNRGAFANADQAMTLHPDFSPRSHEVDGCAPYRTGGSEVEAVRRRLLERLDGLGFDAAEPVSLTVEAIAGDRVIRQPVPPPASGRLLRLSLPAGTDRLCLRSDVGVPAGLNVAITDVRGLGLCVGALFVDGALVPLDSPALASGFYRVERGGAESWRWTDGAAEIILPPSLRSSGSAPVLVELLVRDVMRVRRPTLAVLRDAA